MDTEQTAAQAELSPEAMAYLERMGSAALALSAATVVAVLREHEYMEGEVIENCDCGWKPVYDHQAYVSPWAQWINHIAEVLSR